MFEAISNTLSMEQTATLSSVSSISPAKTSTATDKIDQQNKKSQGEKSQVSEKMLKELEQDIEALHRVELKFSIHEKTGRVIIKIMDKNDDKLIREIPSEEVLDLAAKMEEMIGILFDRKV